MLVVGVLVGLVAVVMVLRAGSDDRDVADDSTSTQLTTTVASPVDGSEAVGACENVHAGHQMKMWNPTMADEMVDADCGWPYPPFELEPAEGEDDASLDAAFEPRRYSEIWQVITAARLGTCAVATDLNGGGPGALFEFTYSVGPAGCPEARPDGELVVAEYGTEAQRDAAANEAGDGISMVLGRWNVRLTGRAEQLESALVEIGAQRAG